MNGTKIYPQKYVLAHFGEICSEKDIKRKKSLSKRFQGKECSSWTQRSYLISSHGWGDICIDLSYVLIVPFPGLPVTSCLDYCNALYMGPYLKSIQKLQLVQNTV